MQQSEQLLDWPADQVGVKDDGFVETGQVLEGPILIPLLLQLALLDHHSIQDPIGIIHLQIELLQHADANPLEPERREADRSEPLDPPADGVNIVLPQLPNEGVVPILDAPRVALQEPLPLHADEGLEIGVLVIAGQLDQDDDVLLQVVGRGGGRGHEGSDPLDGGVEAVVDGEAGGVGFFGLDSELACLGLPVQVVLGDGGIVLGLAGEEDRGDAGRKTARPGGWTHDAAIIIQIAARIQMAHRINRE